MKTPNQIYQIIVYIINVSDYCLIESIDFNNGIFRDTLSLSLLN